jgi:hypothetical protein
MKKSLIFGLIAVVSAGLLLAGCSQATDSDTTYLDKYGIYGTVGAELLQARIDEAIASGGVIVLADGLTIDGTNASAVDFKTARVQVNGEVDATGITINAVDAAVTWLDGGAFTSTGGGVYLYRNAEDILKPDNTSRLDSDITGAQFFNRLQDISETATHAAVRNFTFGTTQDFDYSTVPTGVSAKVNATTLSNLYVLGTLTVPAGGVAPGITVNVLGTVDVTGNNDVVLAGATVVMTDPATLTSSVVGGAVIKLPDSDPSIPNALIESGKDITVNSGTTTTFKLPGKLDGPGTLKVTPALTTIITIGGGNGNAVFTNAAFASTGLYLGNTGTTTFEGTFTNTSGNAVIAGNVVFKGDVARTAGTVWFGGDVTLYNGKTITLTTDGTVTLAAGKKIIVGGGAVSGGSGETVPLAPVLEAAADTLLTPATGAILTAGAVYGSSASEAEIAAAKSVSLGTAALAITSGTLRVAAGATLDVNGVTLSTTGIAGRLSLADGATVQLTGADSKIDFGTVASEATVAGNTTNVTFLTASGAAVTLGDDTISGAGATLAPGIAASGSVDAVITTADGKNLTLDGVTLDLSVSGKVTVNATGSLTLVNQGTLYLAEGGFENDWGFIKYTDYFAKLGGGVRSALGATEQNDTAVVINLNSIAHRSGGGVTIQADGTNAIDFVKGSGVPQLSKLGSS